MAKRLSESERKAALDELPDWQLVKDRDAIQKTFKFRNFNEAFAFMAKCALKAEQLDHHPEWFNSYNQIDVTLTTHSCKGLSELDIKLAKFMDWAQ